MDYIRNQQVASIVESFGESIQGDSEIENGKFDIVFGSAVWLSSSDQGLAGWKLKLQEYSLKLLLLWSSSLSELSIILFAAKFLAFPTINH